jgi:GTP diphosphokinase / guanosine-3',5'-bis(diphosphate) 3'-diphosphatase
VVEIVTDEKAEPNPAWLSFVKTGRARSKIRHYLKTVAQDKSYELGGACWGRRCGPKALPSFPDDDEALPAGLGKAAALHRQQEPGRAAVRHRHGQAHCQHGGQENGGAAGRQWHQARRGADQHRALCHRTRRILTQGVVTLDGSEGLSVQYATCCKPIPGDRIVGYLGRGEGLVVHAEDCPVCRRLLARDSERFLAVEWADEPRARSKPRCR